MKRFFVITLATLVLGAALAPLQAQETKALRTETIRLSYLNVGQAQRLLYPYLSKNGAIVLDQENGKFLTIRDHSEFVEKVLAVIKEIDVKPVDFLFTIQLVVGSSAGEGKGDEVLLNDPIIRELKNLLTYKSFTLLDSNFIRTIEDERAELMMGKEGEFKLDLMPRFTKDGAEDVIRLFIRLTKIEKPAPALGQQAANTSARVMIETQLSMKSGEKTVVGVSKLDGGDKGLIFILSGKIIK